MFSDALSRARWLFDFVRLDLDGLLIDAWRALRREAWEFINDGDSVIERDTHVGFSTDETAVLVDPTAIRDVQEEIRRGLQAVHDGHWWSVTAPKAYGIARWGQGVRRGLRSGVFKVLFVATALDIVEAHWSDMRRCPWCELWFLRRGKQAYCSTACSRKSRWMRFKPHRRARDYRAERERAVRNRLGARVKVGRDIKRRPISTRRRRG
jgi:hypothetical protein